MSPPFYTLLQDHLQPLGDPERARGQQAYMKSEMPYLGITAPVQQKITRTLIREHPFVTQDAWQASTLDVWRNASHREYRYCAIQLAGAPTEDEWLNLQALPMLEEMVVDGAWWDYVDALATRHFGRLLNDHPTPLKRLLRRWARDDDMWRRRVAMLAQLKFKERTDEKLLRDVLHPSLGENAFFLSKGIGWALREYSKTAPQFVIAYVHEHADVLSGLSKREGLKVLLKQGIVDGIP